MADKAIGSLPQASTVNFNDLFVLEQNGTAKSCTGALFLQMIEAHGGIASVSLGADYKLTLVFADGTSWTSSVSLQGPQGTQGNPGQNGADGEDGENGLDASITTTEYGTSNSSSTQPTIWQSTIPSVAGGNFLWTRFTWNTGVYTYITTRYGSDGQGAGDMLSSVYDSTSAVANAGGIVAYVDANGGKIDHIQLNGSEIAITNKTVNIQPDAEDIYYDESNSVAEKIQAIEASISGVESALASL